MNAQNKRALQAERKARGMCIDCGVNEADFMVRPRGMTVIWARCGGCIDKLAAKKRANREAKLKAQAAKIAAAGQPVTAAYIDAHKGNDSRYGWLVKNYGQDFADRWMRNAEVASWDFGGLK